MSCEGEITSSDFEGGCPSGTATIAAGSGFDRFTIETNDDMALENAEEFTVSVIEALPRIDGRITISSTRSSVTATITDNDTADIGFEALRYEVSEDEGSLTLTVSVLSGEIGEGVFVTVDVRSIDGSAVAGADYTSVRESLTFTSSMTEATVTVVITDDAIVEGNEEFSLALSGESISSAATTAEVLIRDNDDGVITVTAVTGTVSEGEAANFRLELTEGSTETGIGVEWSVSCEGDVSAEDFVGGCPSGTATIAAGQISTIFTITTNSDSVVENDEKFTVSITGIEDLITISGTMSTASVTIEDEAVLSVSAPADVEELATGMSVARFTVSLADGVTAVSDITLSWSVTCATDVTGVASPADFANGECPSGTATILAGQTSAVFSFTALDDEMREGTESFTVSIVTMTAGDFDVVFDDGADGFVREFVAELDLLDAQSVNFEVRVRPLSVSEGGSVTFELVLDDNASTVSEALTLPWAISFGSSSESDFASGQAFSGTAEIPANMRTSALVTVSVASDTVVEGDEFFNVIIPVEGRPTSEEFVIQSVEVSSDRVTILDDPADRGVITVTAVTGTVSEGGEVTFRVDLSGGVTAEEVIGVEWSVSCVVGSGITAGDFADSVCPSGTVAIVSGETSATFAVRTVVDNVVEGSEEFTVRLMTDVVPNIGGRITVSDSMSSASATIEDTDRGVVSVTVVTRTVSEGGDVTFRVELSDGVSVRESIGVAWVVNCEGGVTAGDFADSVCPSGTVTIADGRSSATFFVSTNDDDVFEGDEEFTVRLTSVLPEGQVTISDTMSTASATINDNDAGLGFEDLRYDVLESAGSVTLIVVLSGAISSVDDLIVNVRTVDGTAGDQDYEGIDIPLNFTNFFGFSSVPVSVDITPDRIVEGAESFVVTLSGARVSVARSSATVTILDDDRGVISVEAATDMVLEGDDVTFTVNLSGDGGDVTGSADISVAWSVSCSGDITAADFGECPSGIETISPGQSSATFAVSTIDDSIAEAMEVFIVMLTGVSSEIEDRITISDSMSVARVTILDDDAIGVEIGFSPVAYMVDEDAGNVELTVSVLSGDIESGVSVAVTVMTVDGSAVVGEDYTATTATLTFTSSVTEATVTVDILDDVLVEGNETFEVSLSGERVSSGSGVARVTIIDNDVEIGFSPDEYMVDEDAGSVELTVLVL